MEKALVTIDGFRFIDTLHTTARQIPVFTALVKILGGKQLTKSIIEQQLIVWSIDEERNNSSYRNSKGKITKEGAKTGALRYHIELSPSLGLTYRIDTLYQNTKITKTFLEVFNGIDKKESSLCERIFYLYQLVKLDADGLIILLEALVNGKGKSQSKLQKEFKTSLNQRLQLKEALSPPRARILINEKFRAINFFWSNAEKYAEHLIAPRYEWLCYLGLVEIERGKNTIYSLSAAGNEFYKLLPEVVSDKSLRDVSNDWINNYFFSLLNLVYPNTPRVPIESLQPSVQHFEIASALLSARKAIKSSMSFKMPLEETMFYISVLFYIEKGIVVNFAFLLNKLKAGLIKGDRKFVAKVLDRLDKGYITITAIE